MKDLLRRMAIKHLGLIAPTGNDNYKPTVLVKSAGVITIEITSLARAQIEAEKCTSAMEAMIGYYSRNNGDVDDEFTAACVRLMESATGTVQRLSEASNK